MQLSFFSNLPEAPKESVGDVLGELSKNCSSCRLALIHPNNRGILYRGNPNAKIAMLGEAPRNGETEKGVPWLGPQGKELDKWIRYINLDPHKDVFLLNTIQCQPPKEERNHKLQQREPHRDEIGACFGPRALRVLRAMPNLEVVITLGWVAAKSMLSPYAPPQESPKSKSHEGQYFESSYLPGVVVVCMQDPDQLIFKDVPEKKATVVKYLDYFKREYLQSRKVVGLAQAAREAREEQGIGMF
jgi:uracil-DNA glycosylase family 4